MEDAEWSEVAAGLLPEAKTNELMKHAAQCGHCGPLLKNAGEALMDETTPSEEALLTSLQSARPEWRKNMAERLRSRSGPKKIGEKEYIRKQEVESSPWRQGLFSWPRPAFAFAGAVVAIMAAWLGWRALHPPSADQLLAQAYTEHRTLEVRIAGAKYSPVRVERSAAGSSLDRPPSLLKAESIISENLGRQPNNPSWLQAKARADLLEGNYEAAIATLQEVQDTDAANSHNVLIDLGSAYFERASAADRPIDYGNAIEVLGKALARAPDDPVALFNRALICERAHLYTQALDDWEHYLRVDPSGEWADEARHRLSSLKGQLERHKQSRRDSLLLPSEIARADGKNVALQRKIDDRLEDYLNLAVTEWLPRYDGSSNVGSTELADLRLALGVVSEVSKQSHGDAWLNDTLAGASAVHFQLAARHLSQAVEADEIGDNVSARAHAYKAETLFASDGNEAGALRARIEYLFASHDAQEARPCIIAAEGLGSRLGRHAYRWLNAQSRIELATCYWLAGDLGKAWRLYQEASTEANASGYNQLYLRTQDHLSSLGTVTGNLSGSWNRSERALALYWSHSYPEMRGYNLYYGLYEAARIDKQPNLQMAVWRDGIALSESFEDRVLSAMAHSLMASAAIAAERPKIAEKELIEAQELFALAPQIRSTRIARVEADARLADVESIEGGSQSVISHLRELQPEVAQLSDNFLGILYYTTLATSLSRGGEIKDAESALQSAIGLSETQLQSLRDDKSRTEWSQITSASYRNLAELKLRDGDVEDALEIWESYRGAVLRSETKSPLSLASDSSVRGPHKAAAERPSLKRETVVSYALLPHGLAVWVYDDRGTFEHWTEENTSAIEAKVARFRKLCSDPKSVAAELDRSARSLYDLFVAPIENHLDWSRILIIELDEDLLSLPFDALIDTQDRYLGDRTAILSSLGVYSREAANVGASITSSVPVLAAAPISSLTSDSSALPLPDAVAEAETVAQVFPNTELLEGRDATVEGILSRLPGAVVFHFAGHAITSPQQSGLLLFDGVLNASSLGRTPLRHLQLAVLSACNTESVEQASIVTPDNLVRGFLLAGVPHVVASTWNVDSVAARQFMNFFYRALLAGDTVPEAIRQAKIALRTVPGMAHPYYWSAFIAFGAV
jgi:CHAT domain-containing protein